MWLTSRRRRTQVARIFNLVFASLRSRRDLGSWQKARELLPMQRWEIEISKFNLELFNFILPRVFICKSRNGFKVYSFRVHPKVKRTFLKSFDYLHQYLIITKKYSIVTKYCEKPFTFDIGHFVGRFQRGLMIVLPPISWLRLPKASKIWNTSVSKHKQ